jgi:hypothetical protein
VASLSHPTTPAAAPAVPAHEVPTAAGSDAAAPGGKLGKWLARTKPSDGGQQQQQPSSTPVNDAAGQPAAGGGKLGRWLSKARQSPGPTPPPEQGSVAGASSSWPGAAEGGTSSSSGEDDESEEHVRRIRESFAAVDSALKLLSEWQLDGKGAGADGKGPQGPLCPQCRGEVAGRCGSSDQPTNKASTPAQSRGMGMRVEETHRGLSVSHVVPGGPGEEAGIEVLDIIKNVNGRAVSRLKELGATMRDASGTGYCSLP